MSPDSGTAIPILWNDDSAVAVNKLSGLLVHNSRYAGPKERSLRQMLGAQLGRPVYPLHRLDRPTSGVVLFAFEQIKVQAWQQRLTHDSTENIYLALVRGHVTESVRIDHPLKFGDIRKAACSEVIPLAISAVERCSLVQVRLYTGRKHQVRRRLAHISHPLVGDTTHGKGEINRHYRATYDLWRLALHAWQLNITHPFTEERLSLRANLPPELKRVLSTLFPKDVLLRHMLTAVE
ncbi:MAG: pseudouridylate synthase [Chloroflexi bacterium]|nr:pseudouridylate synthase [Chloroflexota bacterium]